MNKIFQPIPTVLLLAATLAVGVGAGAILVGGMPGTGADGSPGNEVAMSGGSARCRLASPCESSDERSASPGILVLADEPAFDPGTRAFVSGDYAFAPQSDAPLAGDPSVGQLKGKLMPSVESLRDALSLPPLPDGCADLRMNEIFEKPGDFGMEYTAKAKSLDGKKVRLLGFMVNRCAHSPGMFLLTSMPVTTHEHEMGLADDLPMATVHVFMPQSPTIEGDTPRTRRLGVVPSTHQYGELLPGAVPWTPGLLLLTGTLRTGTREEADGRVSVARLELDALAEGSPVRWGRGAEEADAPAGQGGGSKLPNGQMAKLPNG